MSKKYGIYGIKNLRSKSSPKKQLQYPEPVRRSLYDVMTDNLKAADRLTYIHRIIYIGEHTFPPGETENIDTYFKKIIDYVNTCYCEEYLTGFLLVYTKYFSHIVEGSEETIAKHFQLMFTNQNISKRLGRVKLLISYHHANKRLLSSWTQLHARPPTLLEKFYPASDLQTTSTKVITCVQKLYRLGKSLKPVEPTEANDLMKARFAYNEESEEPPERLSVIVPERGVSFTKDTPLRNSISKILTTVSNLQGLGPPNTILPEYNLLDFLLSSKYIMDISVYANAYGNVPILVTFLENVWPVSTDFVPSNIFDKDANPIEDLTNTTEQTEDDYNETNT